MLMKLKENAGAAGLTVAVIALFVALTGIAGALPGKKSVDKNDLKKNVVASKNVADDSLTGSDIKESTLQIPAAALPTATIGLSVSAGGAIQSSTLQGVSVAPQGSGNYNITFPRSITGCNPVASDGSTGGVPTALRAGVSSSTVLFIGTASNANTAFNLIMTCPS
jgi:hypothetical protein